MKRFFHIKQLLVLLLITLCLFTACAGNRPSTAEDSSVNSENGSEGSTAEGNIGNESLSANTVDLQLFGADVLLDETISLVKPQSAYTLCVYAGILDFTVYVDENGMIRQAGLNYNDGSGLFDGLDVTGLPFEEGFVRILTAMYEKELWGNISAIDLSFVSHEKGTERWLMKTGVDLVTEFLSSKKISPISVNPGVNLYLKDSSSPTYVFCEEHKPGEYKDIEAKLALYDELVRTGETAEEFRRLSEIHRTDGLPFSLTLDLDGYQVTVCYDDPEVIREISMSGGYAFINLYRVPGTDVYRSRISVLCEVESSIFWPDGRIDNFLGDDASQVKIPGEVMGNIVYLPDAELVDYGEVMALLDKYAENAAADEYQKWLIIDQGDRIVNISDNFTADQLVISKTREQEEEVFIYENGTLSSHIKQVMDDLYRPVYIFEETPTEIREETIDLDGGRETETIYDKETGYTQNNTYKIVKKDSTYTWYDLRRENHWHINEFEYVSEDSHVLKTFKSTDQSTGEVVYWVLDGKDPGNQEYADHVISLTRTLNGVTKTYSSDQVPWGTGMTYPPHFAHEYTRHSVSYGE